MKIVLEINSGICKCGCSWEDHHLNFIMNQDVISAIQKLHKDYPLYVPDECESYGFNETGGLRYNPETGCYDDHCHKYQDKDGPLDTIY